MQLVDESEMLAATRAPRALRQHAGFGYSIGHFGELLQGMFVDANGRLVRGLVTLPCKEFATSCLVDIHEGSGGVEAPADRWKTRRAIEAYLALHALQAADSRVVVRVQSNIPIGIGMGSSTADIVATVKALDCAFGRQTKPAQIAKLAVAVEVACDSTMFPDRVVLYAQREGFIIEELGPLLPPMTIVGFNLMPGEIFSTIDNPPAEYGQAEIDEFERLRRRLRSGIQARDARAVAQVATQSALINQRHYPKRSFERFLAAARRTGALGVIVSHSGTVGGLVFEPAVVPRHTSEVKRFLDGTSCEVLAAAIRI